MLLGMCYKELGKMDTAKEYLREAMERLGPQPDARWEFAQIVAQSNDPQELEEAVDSLELLIRNRNFQKDEPATILLQRALERLGRIEDAYTAVERLCKAGTKNA